MLLHGTLRVDGLSFECFQVSPGGELLDDVLVTRFPATGGEDSFVRVAVFDPAENYAYPDSRRTAHRAAAVARRWMRSESDPIVALHGAALELHDPALPYDANPLTTVAWADLRRDGDGVLLLNAGRCSDSEVLVEEDGVYRRLLTAPMLTPQAEMAWSAAMAHTRAAVPPHRWGPRRWHSRGLLLSPSDFVNPHLGLGGTPLPELFEGKGAPLPVSSLVVATDGLGLEEHRGDLDVAASIAALQTRTPPPGMPYAHGDIAAVQVTAG